MYQVTGPCGYFSVPTPQGVMKMQLLRGAIVPDGVPQQQIEHHLSVGLIERVGDDPYQTPVDGNGNSAADVATPLRIELNGGPVATPDAPAESKTDQPDPDVESRRAAARAKLAEAGGKPKGTHGKDVWVEYAVTQGLDRAEAEKVSVAELQKALGK